LNNQVITFGCRLNIFESEVIKNAVANLDDVIVFNTCSVTKEAQRQAYQAIRKAKRDFPLKKIIVTGCAAQLNPEKFALMKEVDQILGNEEKLIASSYVKPEKVVVNDIMSIKESALHLVESFDGKARAFVQIQNGCNHRCTFCIIPFARGNNRSMRQEDIITQITQLVDNGYKEIVLTGVDISDYGGDLEPKSTLAQLIKTLLKEIPALIRLRLSSIDVAEIDAELFELLAYEPRIMPHVHISAQSGDNMILKRMKRRHNREMVLDFCHNLRAKRVDVAFGADFIAGFPTENEEMFKNTLDLVKQAKIQYLHVFPYSAHDKTPAAKMPQVENTIRKARAKELRAAGEVELKEFLSKQVGKNISAIAEGADTLRAENFATIKSNTQTIAGEVYQVKITHALDDKLLGNLVV
jgi:threonylcarbamoyladenosine tRNA methylthiotransferase MtaB